jgi:hypothetical protein
MNKAPDQTDDAYPEAETAAHWEAALMRAFTMPHKPH